MGGFYLPFISIGSIALLTAISLFVVVPNVKTEKMNESNGGNSLTFSGLVRVKNDPCPNLKNFELIYLS